MTGFDRITRRPDVMGGKPCIRGMRVTVGMIVGMIGSGHGIDELLADYPYLEREDILQALRYAAWRAEDVSPEVAAPMVTTAIDRMALELENGALVSVDPIRSRVRYLPFSSRP